MHEVTAGLKVYVGRIEQEMRKETHADINNVIVTTTIFYLKDVYLSARKCNSFFSPTKASLAHEMRISQPIRTFKQFQFSEPSIAAAIYSLAQQDLDRHEQ